MMPGRRPAGAVQFGTASRRAMPYARRMRIDTMKMALGSAWLVGLGALALSSLVTSTSSRVLVFGFGLVPPVIMWMFWAPPTVSLSESINKARE